MLHRLLQVKNFNCLFMQKMAAHAHQAHLQLDKVYLRQEKNGEELNISFRYFDEGLKIDREFNFCRSVREQVDKVTERIKTNVEKEITKRKTKSKKKPPKTNDQNEAVSALANLEVTVDFLLSETKEKLSDITFDEMLTKRSTGSVIQLKVMEQIYNLAVNEPWVNNLGLPTSMLAGCLIYPTKIEIQFAERNFCRGQWFKVKKPPSGDLKRAEWAQCGEGLVYECKNEDIGYHIKFVLMPGNAERRFGPSVEIVSKNEVQAGPGICPFETRHCFTKDNLHGNSFRIVSYNILADLYADSDYTRTYLFPYCPPYALKIDYRKQLFLKEIVGYKADIIALQEVDMKIFKYDLKPLLENVSVGGFDGEIAQKGSCGEGVAVFYRRERFEYVQSVSVNIGENLSSLPNYAKVWNSIKDHKKLAERICDRSTTLLIMLLKSKDTGHYILVANTHLYFHPDADHIRLLQMGFAISYVQRMHDKWLRELAPTKSGDAERKIAILFCGDFNSVPECGIYKLMTEGHVLADFIDWQSNAEEAVNGVTLSQPFKMKSACGTPPFTNYTHEFAACLDYIFYQSDCFEVDQVVPLPAEEQLKAHTAIPSVVFPSDHIALIADLKLN